MPRGNLSVASVFGQVQAVIVNEISRTVLNILGAGPQRVEVVIIVLLVVAAWAWVSKLLIVWIDSAAALRNTKRWRELLKSVISVLQMLGVFLVVQLLLSYITTSVPSSGTGSVEAIAAVFVITFSAIATVHTVKTIA